MSLYAKNPSMRNAMLDVQSQLNRMPLHKLGAVLARADHWAKSTDPADQELGKILREQVLLAMDPTNDSDRIKEA